MMFRNCVRTMFFVCLFFTVSCKKENTGGAEKEYALIEIKAVNQELMTTYSAALRGRQDIDIFPQVSGFITRLHIEEGAVVRKGQVLFEIDRVAYQAALATATANVEAARVGVSTAELNYKSKKELHTNGVVSDFDLKTTENAFLTSKAQLAQMQAQEMIARNNLSFTQVKSPSDGVVGTLPYREGTLVGPSMPKPLTTVSDNSTMYAYFSLNETQLLRLTRRYGSKAELMRALPAVQLRLNDGSLYEKKGRIESISGLIDPTTGTVTLRAAFANTQGILLSGSSANVIIPEMVVGAITIPRSATYELQDKVYVYTVEEGKAKSLPVSVLPIEGGREYIVTEGLEVGQQIIAEGVGMLREGTSVKVQQK